MNFDELIIESDPNEIEYDFHSMKNAMESFVSSVHQDDDSIVDATEQVLDSVDEYLYDFATEAINPKAGLKKAGSIIAKPFKALYNICAGWIAKLKSKKADSPEGEKKKNILVRMWEGLAKTFRGLFSKFSKKDNLSPEEQEEASKELEKGKNQVNDAKNKSQNLYGGKGLGGKVINHQAKKSVKKNLNSDKSQDPSTFDSSMDSIIYSDFDSDDLAMEGIFSKPKTSDAIVAKMQKNVKKLKTVEACDSYLEQLNNEASKFNEAIKSLQSAASEYQTSQDKKALKASVKPVLANLKKTCKLLKISSISGDPKNISEEEIKKLHDVITGAKAAVQSRKQELQSGGSANESFMDDNFLFELQSDDIAEESLAEDFDTYMDYVDAATEGILEPNLKRAHRIQTGEVAKKIAGVVKQARKATKAKEYDEAIKLYQQAKQGYKGLLASARKLPEYKAGVSRFSGKEKDHPKQSFKLDAINWCITKISECDDAIEKIQNRRMKNERKAGEKAARAEKKAAKRAAKENPASESLTALKDALESFDCYDPDDEDIDDMDPAVEDDDEFGDVLESLLQ